VTPYSFFAQNFLLPTLAGLVVALLLSFAHIPLKKRLAIAVAFFLVAWLVSASVSWHRTPKPRLIVEGTVVDEANNNGIGQAVVSLADGGKSCTSVDNGNFVIDLTGYLKESQRIRIRVTKDGYKPYDGTVAAPTHDFVVPLHHL
jgi:hypothetical protein